MSILKMNVCQTMEFVDLYKKCDCLWNIKSTKYRDRVSRDQALQFISDKMNICGFNAREVAQKIKNVRTTYKQEVQKINRSLATATSTDDVYEPSIPWFRTADSFLRGLHRKPAAVPRKPAIGKSAPKNDDDEFPLEIAIEPDYPVTSAVSLYSPEHRPSRKRKRSPSDFEHSCSPEVDTYVFQEAQPIRAESEFDLWARSLAIQLNCMDVARALKLQLQIQTLVTNERLEYELSKHLPLHSSSPPTESHADSNQDPNAHS